VVGRGDRRRRGQRCGGRLRDHGGRWLRGRAERCPAFVAEPLLGGVCGATRRTNGLSRQRRAAPTAEPRPFAILIAAPGAANGLVSLHSPDNRSPVASPRRRCVRDVTLGNFDP
jgi:hypothetical protein